jgi:hypothetical protein
VAFIQVIDYETSNPEAVEAAHEAWRESTEGKRNAKRIVRTRYHDDPNRFCDIVFFDSYDQAMQNSDLPETGEFAGRLSEAVKGEPHYWNLDVVDEPGL